MSGTRPARSRNSAIWLQGLACGALLAFASPTALLLAVMLCPAIACTLADTGTDKGMSRAVAAACAAFTLGPLWHLWLALDRMDAAIAILCTPTSVCLAWGAGAIAWALCQVLPVIIRTTWDAREDLRAKSLAAELQTLREEWDLNE
jgi:fumarate reductase subunit D